MKRFARALTAFGLIAICLGGITAYVQLFSEIKFAGSSITGEESVRIIHPPARIREAFKASPLMQQMRETYRMRTQTSQQLIALGQMRDEMTRSTTEAERVAQLDPDALIREFPDDTTALAAVPPDMPRVVKYNPPSPTLDTRQMQVALGISYREALKLKWGTDGTVLEPGVSHAPEREAARNAAIRAIGQRFEAELVKKYGKTASEVQAEIASTQVLLEQIDKVRSRLEDEAFKALRNTGTEMAAASRLRVRRRPALLILERHRRVVELTGARFWVVINTDKQSAALDEYIFEHL